MSALNHSLVLKIWDGYVLKFMEFSYYGSKAVVTALLKLQKIYGNEGSVFFSHPALGDRADALERAI